MSIKLSPKYGVNPSMIQCFFCGEETGEIALLGRLPKDAEAPKHAVANHEPCKKCKERFSTGFVIFEALPDRTLTGTYWIMDNEHMRTILSDSMFKRGKALVTEEQARTLGLYDTDTNLH